MSKIPDGERERKREARVVEALAEGCHNDVIRRVVEALSWPDRRGKMSRLWRHLFPVHEPGVPESVVIGAVATKLSTDQGAPGLRDAVISCLGAMVCRGELRVEAARMRHLERGARGYVEVTTYLPGRPTEAAGLPAVVADGDRAAEWSVPMPKAEIARRLLGSEPGARFRKIARLVIDYGLRRASAHKWQVRLDSMPPNHRKLFEPNNGSN